MEPAGAGELMLDCPYFRLYKDGHIDRLTGTETVPAGFDPVTGVTSRDFVLDDDTGLYVRLYLPDLSSATHGSSTLPLLVYSHGGGFVIDSPASPKYHRFVNSLASKARVVAVSVGYRLAPEHHLPAAWEDCWAVLDWALSRGDPWLHAHADISRVFLAGDSAGAYITHNLAMRVGLDGVQPAEARIVGAILIHAGFPGKDPVSPEETPEFLALTEKLWRFAFPDIEDMDDPRINPLATAAPRLSALGCRKLMMCVAEKDGVAPRSRAYYDALVASGWPGRAEWFLSAGEDHVFFLKQPESEKAAELMEKLVSFLADFDG